MRKLIIIVSLLALVSCSKKSEEGKTSVADKRRVEICAFKINKVILRDTTSIRNIFYTKSDSGLVTISDHIYEYDKETRYLNSFQFNELTRSVWELVKNPGSRVYYDPNGKPLTAKEARDRIMRCEMVQQVEFDAEGNEIISSKFMCDSTSAIHNINMIRFFESWYFNPANNMIERDMLGYSIHEYVYDKMAYRELFSVFKDEASLKKAKQYYYNKQ